MTRFPQSQCTFRSMQLSTPYLENNKKQFEAKSLFLCSQFILSLRSDLLCFYKELFQKNSTISLRHSLLYNLRTQCSIGLLYSACLPTLLEQAFFMWPATDGIAESFSLQISSGNNRLLPICETRFGFSKASSVVITFVNKALSFAKLF